MRSTSSDGMSAPSVEAYRPRRVHSGVRRLAVALGALTALAGCGATSNHDDRPQTSAMQSDPVFEITVPGGTGGDFLIVGSGGGPQSGPIQVTRRWKLPSFDDGAFASVITSERQANVRFDLVYCAEMFQAHGLTGTGEVVV